MTLKNHCRFWCDRIKVGWSGYGNDDDYPNSPDILLIQLPAFGLRLAFYPFDCWKWQIEANREKDLLSIDLPLFSCQIAWGDRKCVMADATDNKNQRSKQGLEQ